MRIDVKMEKMSQKALERKSNKPIMEKKRRARINHCLNQLKALILETDNERSRHSKLEKADILEMTVRYLQTLRTYHLHLQQLHQITQQQQPSHQHPHSQHPHLHGNQHQAPVNTAQLLQQFHSAQQQAAAVAAAAQLQLQIQSNSLPLQLQTQQQQSPQTDGSELSPTWRPW